MTTTHTSRNPWAKAILSFIAELTTPESQKWHLQQLQTTATLAQTIAHYSFTTAQRLLSDRNSVALAAIAEPESAIAQQQEYAQAQAEAIAPEPDFGEAITNDGKAALAVSAVPLDDDDDTELRYWAELELPSILDEEYSHLVDDADNSAAGAEAED
jgi:hypothetical protein